MTGDSSDRPSWPARPLDPDCRESVDPRRDVAEVVRWLWTDFDPDQRPNGWAAVRSLLLEEGKSDEELRNWSYEDVEMFFRINWRRLRQEKVGTIHFGMTTHTPSTQTLEMPSVVPETASTLGVGGIIFGRADLTTALKALWNTRDGKIYLLSETVRKIATDLGLAAHSSLSENDFYKCTIKPLREKGKVRVQAADWLDQRSRDKR
jgi:hypothetical protein